MFRVTSRDGWCGICAVQNDTSTGISANTSVIPRQHGRIYREANGAQNSGPFICSAHFQGPGRGPSNALGVPQNLPAHIRKKLHRLLANLTPVLKNYIKIPITSCEADRESSKLSIIKKKEFPSTMPEERLNFLSTLTIENITKFRSTILEERLNFLSTLSIENITNSLSYET